MRFLRGLGLLLSLLSGPASAASSCGVSDAQLQNEAMALLHRDYPDRSFFRGTTTDVILMGRVELSLRELMASLCQGPVPASRREAEIRRYFAALMVQTRGIHSYVPRDWVRAQKVISLQLINEDALREPGEAKTLVARPFIPGVLLAVVVDQQDGYGYVRRTDRARWKVDDNILFQQAQRNLGRLTQLAALEEIEGEAGRLLLMKQGDGYDAARILVPAVRQRAARFLGEPFLVAVPNRNELAMWSANSGEEFQQLARRNINRDFRNHPHALSGRVLRVWANGRVEVGMADPGGP